MMELWHAWHIKVGMQQIALPIAVGSPPRGHGKKARREEQRRLLHAREADRRCGGSQSTAALRLIARVVGTGAQEDTDRRELCSMRAVEMAGSMGELAWALRSRLRR